LSEITIEKQFKIIAILACQDDHVILSLEKVEEFPAGMVDVQPVIKNENERVGFEIGIGIMKGMGGGAVMLGPGGFMGSPGTPQSTSHIINIKIPLQDYHTLGSPTVNQIILLDVKASVQHDPVETIRLPPVG